ncbi:MAG: type IV pilus modification PilV family protein [Nitrospiria bacterium]
MQRGARTRTGAYWFVREDAGSQRQGSRWPLLNGSGMRGFTFLEVILALTLFTFGLLAITRMFGFSTQAIQFSGNRTKAILVAQEKMEALKSIPYDNLLSASGGEDRLTEIASSDGIHTFQDTQGLIQRTWTIQKDQPILGLGLITVRTNWLDAGGKTKEVSLVTLRTNLSNGRE